MQPILNPILDKSTLLSVVADLPLTNNKSQVDLSLLRLVQVPDALWFDSEIRTQVKATLAATCKVLRQVLEMLTSEGSLDPGHRAYLGRLVRWASVTETMGYLLPNLLLALHRRKLVDVAPVLSTSFRFYSSEQCLITCLLTSIACVPNALSEGQLRRAAVFRSRRIKWLCGLLLSLRMQDRTSKEEVNGYFSNFSNRLHLDVIHDVCWLTSNGTSDLAHSCLQACVEAGDLRDCDLLIPLLARIPTTVSQQLLIKLAEESDKRVSDIAKLTLASAGVS